MDFHNKSKAKMKEFFMLIQDATMCLNEGIKDITTYGKRKTMIYRLISESKAEFNTDYKRRMLLLNENNKDSNEIKVMYMRYLMKMKRDNIDMDGEWTSSIKRIRKQVSKSEVSYKFHQPANTTHYTLREIIKYATISNPKVSVNAFYLFGKNQVPPTILCGKSTLFRHYKAYKSTGVLPIEGDDGVSVGCPKLICNNQLKNLNNSLSTVGYAEGVDGLKVAMVDEIQTAHDERHLLKYTKAPCDSTLQLYQAKATLIDELVSLVKTKYTMNKTSRRQMASTSVRNLLSHICAIAYSNFFPCKTRWHGYYKVTKGAQEFIDIIQMVTGTFVQPINPAFLLNEDCSSQYFYSGIAPNRNKDKSYSRVKVDAIDDRNRSSIWINGDSSEEPCSGIRVKYACGGSAAGFIYPICILISGLNDSEMPNEDFVVVNVEGLGINGRIDPRNKEVGYVCFMKKDVKQLHFFDWFYNNVTYPTVVAIRKRYNAFYDNDTEPNEEEPQQIHQTNSFYGEIVTSPTYSK